MRHTSLLLGGLLSTLAFTSHAQNHDDSHHQTDESHGHAAAEHVHQDAEHSQQGSASLSAHEHGVATLNLVIDGKSLLFELQSPAANIVGFEHMPTSKNDRATVDQAHLRLTQANALFVMSDAAACVLEQVETESPLFAAATSEVHGHDKAHDDDHHAEHADHHDHASHDDHADEGSAHSDISAHFHFACSNPEGLQQIDVRLFDVFPNTEKLLLQAITPTGQQGGELTPANSVIRL
jgi:ABC-type Zn2+ transport system substrate-binding protein/surface adhesin